MKSKATGPDVCVWLCEQLCSSIVRACLRVCDTDAYDFHLQLMQYVWDQGCTVPQLDTPQESRSNFFGPKEKPLFYVGPPGARRRCQMPSWAALRFNTSNDPGCEHGRATKFMHTPDVMREFEQGLKDLLAESGQQVIRGRYYLVASPARREITCVFPSCSPPSRATIVCLATRSAAHLSGHNSGTLM